MPRHHMQHAPNVWPILFTHNENIAHVMPCVTARAVTSCAHRAACARRHAGMPAILIIRGMPKITYGCDIHASQTIFINNSCLTF